MMKLRYVFLLSVCTLISTKAYGTKTLEEIKFSPNEQEIKSVKQKTPVVVKSPGDTYIFEADFEIEEGEGAILPLPSPNITCQEILCEQETLGLPMPKRFFLFFPTIINDTDDSHIILTKATLRKRLFKFKLLSLRDTLINLIKREKLITVNNISTWMSALPSDLKGLFSLDDIGS